MILFNQISHNDNLKRKQTASASNQYAKQTRQMKHIERIVPFIIESWMMILII